MIKMNVINIEKQEEEKSCKEYHSNVNLTKNETHTDIQNQSDLNDTLARQTVSNLKKRRMFNQKIKDYLWDLFCIYKF